MKLTNLNCPQCNGLLNQERDMFFCSSCGSAFSVDYDEHDVRYAQLVTEAERTKMLLSKDINLMQTDYALNEQVLENEQNREFSRQRKNAARTAFTGLRAAIFGLIVSMLPMIGISGYLVYTLHNAEVSYEEKREEKNQNLYELIKDDMHFIENVVASGRAYICYSRNEPLNEPVEDDRYVEPRIAHFNDDVAIDSVYVMVGETYHRPYVLCIYSMSYTYEDTGEIITLYDYIMFTDMNIDSYGLLEVNYTPSSRSGGDYVWDAYYDKDQLFREVIKDTTGSYEEYKLDIPDEWKEAQ